MKRLLTKYILSLAAFAFGVCGAVSARETYNINRDWKFFTFDENSSQIVNLPHQWNIDALGGREDYYRGTGNYMRYVELRPEWRDRRIYLRFGGANTVTDLLVNGRYVGRHSGGSNAFVFDITDYLNFNGRDLLWVAVNNGRQIDVMPTGGDCISYGGLFRDADIIVQSPTSIALNHFCSDGIYINTKSVSAEKVEGEINVKISSQQVVSATLQINVVDPSGAQVLSATTKVRTAVGMTDTYVPFEINNPVLWHGTENPALYRFNVQLSSGGAVQDATSCTSGFRYYEVSKEGFILNGKPYPIHGVLLHRDRPLTGSAMGEREIAEDVDIALEMGANAIRVVGGSHHHSFYDLCDRKGIIVINDLPFIGSATINGKGFYNTENFKQNGRDQLSEMIYQLYNHPSVMVWNLFSEMELRGESPIGYIRDLNSLAKRLNPNRFTSGWSNQDGEINFITDLIVWSHTFGWTDGLPSDITVWQEQLHSTPAWSVLKSAVSYKCGGSVFQQSDVLEKPLASSSWHPERWQTFFHETYLGALRDDRLFWGTFVDCLFDFASSGLPKASGGINDMGVVSFNRQVRKDAFYLYKSAWNTKDPFIQIAEKRWDKRTDTLQTIKVYTNMPDVALTVNGKFMGRQINSDGIVEWTGVVLQKGMNVIEASSGDKHDGTTIEIPFSYSGSL